VFDIIQEDVDTPENSIERFIGPAYYVPDTKRVGELLQELRANRVHMAIVIDEYGGTDGIVTLEDAIEEIFGEIQDEYDGEPPAVERVGANSLLLDAGLDIEEAGKALGIELPHQDAETVGGFVLNRAGKIPAAGETVVYRNVTFTVVEADEHSISKVKVDIKQEKQDET
jgi:CBS domain containing-hemolysin-like protein